MGTVRWHEGVAYDMETGEPIGLGIRRSWAEQVRREIEADNVARWAAEREAMSGDVIGPPHWNWRVDDLIAKILDRLADERAMKQLPQLPHFPTRHTAHTAGYADTVQCNAETCTDVA